MSGGVPRPIRAIAGVFALVALLLVVNGWLRDYRGDSDGGAARSETTATPDAADAPDAQDESESGEPPEGGADEESPGQGVVVVTIDGLNFRRTPASDGELIRGLGRNDRLTYLGTANGWHHVRDSAGVEGYVSANDQYTRLEE